MSMGSEAKSFIPRGFEIDVAVLSNCEWMKLRLMCLMDSKACYDKGICDLRATPERNESEHEQWHSFNSAVRGLFAATFIVALAVRLFLAALTDVPVVHASCSNLHGLVHC